MKNKLAIGFAFTVVAVIALFYGINAKVYPVATVNNSFISTRSFQLAASAAQAYYGAIGLPAQVASTTQAQFISQMRMVALQALIEDRLVTARLEELFEPSDLAAAMTERTSAALASSSEQTTVAVKELFGLSLDEFQEIILAPQARIELLQSELVNSGTDYDSWLEVELSQAQVSIVVSDLVWEGSRVELSGQQPYTAKVKAIFEQLASTTEALQQAASSTTEGVPVQ